MKEKLETFVFRTGANTVPNERVRDKCRDLKDNFERSCDIDFLPVWVISNLCSQLLF